MNNTYKYIILYVGYFFILSITLYTINNYHQKNIQLQKSMLIKQAQQHFDTQAQTREWASNFGGVYVKPINDLQPNPYLKNATLKVDDNLTLIKINPAWMTRQLSDISILAKHKSNQKSNQFHFRITSLHPLNPDNKSIGFETRALEVFKKSQANEYYELNNKTFQYMGALVTQQSCIPCHQEQNYKLGEIRGGISISLDASQYLTIRALTKSRTITIQIAVILLFSIVALLLYKQLKSQDSLETEVLSKTKEISKTKELIQKVLDADHSFLMVAGDGKLILANKSMLDFFESDSLEDFLDKHGLLSNMFESHKDEKLLQQYMDGEHWIDYLQREQLTQNIRVLLKKDGLKRYFTAHSQELFQENKHLHIIIMDEITQELQKIKSLKKEASKDALTQLFNRRKIDDVLSKEITLAQATQRPLSIIFLDIDYFKKVNDTYGHDVGDAVLIEISQLLLLSIRTGDFVARWGGEEFIITLQSTNVKQAQFLAQKIRQKVQEYQFSKGGKQTISLGVTEYIQDETQESFTKRVDLALYKAKENGRNRVEVL